MSVLYRKITPDIKDVKLLEKTSIGKIKTHLHFSNSTAHLTSVDLGELSYPNLIKNWSMVKYPRDS